MENFLYIGLGNNGSRFSGTRHNLGIEALQAWVEARQADESCQVSPWRDSSDNSQLSVVSSQLWQVHCLFPTTMMNDSGKAVALFLQKHPVPLSHVVVIHDEVELPLGEIKVTTGGSAKGHNGVRSIQEALATQEFTRVHLGVGRPPEGVALHEFVLGTFLPEEQSAVGELLQKNQIELNAIPRLPQG